LTCNVLKNVPGYPDLRLKVREGQVIKRDEGVGERNALGRGKRNKGTRKKRRWGMASEGIRGGNGREKEWEGEFCFMLSGG